MLNNPWINTWQAATNHIADMVSLTGKLLDDDLLYLKKTMQSYLAIQDQQLELLNKNPLELMNSSLEYSTDFLERSILFFDTLRKRGNQYYEHKALGQPPVLIFKYQMIADGRTFKRPVNYALVEIIPPDHIEIDEDKRPFVIIDPRAGHGSGIGGFKDDSQVGVALKRGHPVYFVIFFSTPEPHQTLRDITLAEKKFLKLIAKRHPNSEKPCIIGNCQGGWAAMALVAAHPDVASVIVINGAPLSYWAGENGKNPMKYAGGLLGGSWLAQLASDLNNGHFDGAHLVLNFELLNPANTFWKKHYDLFANIDTEEEAFLKFERWWGGFIMLNGNEMRSIADNLFIGNKLAHGKIPLDRKKNIDLRNINLPIIIFCSEGDNITPPEQALHWIADLYPSITELKAAGQVIIYYVHEHVGHLGLFVSSKVSQKEHKKIIDLLNYIEHLQPGLYEMLIHETSNASTYQVSLEERTISDVLAMGGSNKEQDEELFNIVHAVSEFNVLAYDLFLSPFMRATANEFSAEFLQESHPLRLNQKIFSDGNLLLAGLPYLSPYVRDHRHRVADDNPFSMIQNKISDNMELSLDTFREWRDSYAELVFHNVYGFMNYYLPGDLPFRNVLSRDGHEGE